MKGDYSRITHKKCRHYNTVLIQQGRAVNDADLNEQRGIETYLRRTAYRDIIGDCGAPSIGGGFALSTTPDLEDLVIEPGRIYVDGRLCELDGEWVGCSDVDVFAGMLAVETTVLDCIDLEVDQYVEVDTSRSGSERIIGQVREILDDNQIRCDFTEVHTRMLQETPPQRIRRLVTYTTQPDYLDPQPFLPGASPVNDFFYLAYICVSDLHRTADDDPALREVALGGPDTAARLKTLWQVRLMPIVPDPTGGLPTCDVRLDGWDEMVRPSTAKLRVRSNPDAPIDDPCLLPPGAGYRGLENQLYRFEIHEYDESTDSGTFKWSRENGSVVTTVQSIDALEVGVRDLGRDVKLGFATGDWVEIFDDSHALKRLPGVVVQIEVDPDRLVMTVPTGTDLSVVSIARNAKVRRWDGENVQPVVTDEWIEIEQGVEVYFSGGLMRTGDYWVAPARTTTGDVEWPTQTDGSAVPLLSMGVSTAYCRLAIVSWTSNEVLIEDCRRLFDPLTAQSGVPADNSMHITGINWQNDDFLGFGEFAAGLEIYLDSPIDTELLGQVLRVNIEFPVNRIARTSPVPPDSVWTTTTVPGRATESSSNTIRWIPEDRFLRWFSQIDVSFARVTVSLAGGTIWTGSSDENRYLDGYVLGQKVPRSPEGARLALRFPSGTAYGASDFNSWFYTRSEEDPLTILSTRPAGDASEPGPYLGDGFSGDVSIEFRGVPDPTSVNANSVLLHSRPSGQSNAGWRRVTGTAVRYDRASNAAIVGNIRWRASLNYRLTVKGSGSRPIRSDLLGNALDGDGNGSPGGDYVRYFTTFILI
jgi:hypothetical protein